jgi:hypothetical protein
VSPLRSASGIWSDREPAPCALPGVGVGSATTGGRREVRAVLEHGRDVIGDGLDVDLAVLADAAVLLVEVVRGVAGRGSAVRGGPDLRVHCGGQCRLGAGFGLLGAGHVLLGLGVVGFLGRVPLLGLGGVLLGAGLPLAGLGYRLLVELLVVHFLLLGRGVRGLAGRALLLLLGAVLLRSVGAPAVGGCVGGGVGHRCSFPRGISGLWRVPAEEMGDFAPCCA